jgi:dTDP-4-amino-4,6-dideoxygalactose transaminase
MGEGGSVTTRSRAAANYIRLARDAGRTDRYIHQIDGISSGLDEVQAAVLNVRLRHLAEQNQKRRTLADCYLRALAGVGDLSFQQSPRHGFPVNVHHLFVVRTRERERLIKFLKGEDIPALSHYPCTVPQQPFARAEALEQGRFPHSEAAAAEVVSLPLWPSMPHEDQDRVIEAVRRFYGT